ncbi:MAG: GatB/YqeY domain-containing protein [Bacteroidetes bacterium]|nr:GatB/YqeY domain-containing protein [Bacteroidota bacterium]
MALEQQIMTELKAAMLAKNEVALRSLRAIKAAILLAKTSEGAAGELNTDGEIKLLQKMVKQRKDSLEIFTQQGREDLAQKEREEIGVIEKFLPQQMDAVALRAVLVQLVAQAGANSPADMGKVMGLANKELAGKAEGKMIATIVRELLSGQ